VPTLQPEAATAGNPVEVEGHMRQSSGNAPVVSVVIPVYNASADIPVALESVFGQTFSDFEVLVVNDGSSDTAELEDALRPFRMHIQYFSQPNLGAGAARNAGIGASRGRYIAFLDADDCWAPEFLKEQMSYLERRPDCDVVYADARLSGDSALAGRRFMEHAPSEGEVTLESLLLQRCNVILSGVVARRECLVSVGLFDPTLRRGQDFDLWLRLVHAGFRIEYQRKVLLERRVRTTGLSGDTIAELERALTVLIKAGETLDMSPRERAALKSRSNWIVDRLDLEKAKRHIIAGNFQAARHHLSSGVRKSLKARLAILGLIAAPRLVRSAFLARVASVRS
jgi:glycosyltransferase involved in cell wall biosynthesis